MTKSRALPFLFVSTALTLVLACGQGRSDQQRQFDTAAAEPRDIEVTASATGVVQPIRIVEVKSKASGEIIDLPVDTGDWVGTGSRPREALSPRRGESIRPGARRRRRGPRPTRHGAQRIQTRDAALREGAAAAIRFRDQAPRGRECRGATRPRRYAIEIYGERLKETVVVARRLRPHHREERRARKRRLLRGVPGRRRDHAHEDGRPPSRPDPRARRRDRHREGSMPGRTPSIRVDALPGPTFQGTIAKIEPQAVVDQNVTMFPRARRDRQRRRSAQAGDERGSRRFRLPASERAARAERGDQVDAGSGDGRGGRRPDGRRSSRGPRAGGRRSGTRPRASARGRERVAGGGRRGECDRGPARPEPLARAGAAWDSRARARVRANGSGEGRTQTAVVFKFVEGKAVPTVVRTGVSNWEYTQVVSGLAPGDTVILLPSSSLLRQQEEFRDRIRNMSGQPGMAGGGRGAR